MKKWQILLILVGLLGLVYLMNAVALQREAKQEALAKEAKEARLAAEAKAASGKIPSKTGHGPPSFPLPENIGPEEAPVKLEVFLDLSNSCHVTSTELTQLASAYGKLVRIVWLDMSKPEVSRKADLLALGCAAGISINGKVEMMLKTEHGKRMIAFRGPVNSDKFRTPDVYLAVNTVLESKGLTVPEAAKTRTAGAGMITPAGGKMQPPPMPPK